MAFSHRGTKSFLFYARIQFCHPPSPSTHTKAVVPVKQMWRRTAPVYSCHHTPAMIRILYTCGQTDRINKLCVPPPRHVCNLCRRNDLHYCCCICNEEKITEITQTRREEIACRLCDDRGCMR